jgi:hypothetical protein
LIVIFSRWPSGSAGLAGSSDQCVIFANRGSNNRINIEIDDPRLDQAMRRGERGS